VFDWIKMKCTSDWWIDMKESSRDVSIGGPGCFLRQKLRCTVTIHKIYSSWSMVWSCIVYDMHVIIVARFARFVWFTHLLWIGGSACYQTPSMPSLLSRSFLYPLPLPGFSQQPPSAALVREVKRVVVGRGSRVWTWKINSGNLLPCVSLWLATYRFT
jgi:hypothetical protein